MQWPHAVLTLIAHFIDDPRDMCQYMLLSKDVLEIVHNYHPQFWLRVMNTNGNLRRSARYNQPMLIERARREDVVAAYASIVSLMKDADLALSLYDRLIEVTHMAVVNKNYGLLKQLVSRGEMMWPRGLALQCFCGREGLKEAESHPFVEAVVRDDDEAVSVFVDSGVDVNRLWRWNETEANAALIALAHRAKLVLVRLIDSGAALDLTQYKDLQDYSIDLRSPTTRECVKILIEKGVRMTPEQVASTFDKDVVKLFISRGGVMDYDSVQRTLLWHDEELLVEVIRGLPTVDMKLFCKIVPRIWKVETTRLLLDKMKDLNEVYDSHTPLTFLLCVYKWGRGEVKVVIEELLKRGVEYKPDSSGITPALHCLRNYTDEGYTNAKDEYALVIFEMIIKHYPPELIRDDAEVKQALLSRSNRAVTMTYEEVYGVKLVDEAPRFVRRVKR